MSYKFTKITCSSPWLLNNASTAEELTYALEDYMSTGTQIIYNHNGDDCTLVSFEYKTNGISSTIVAYFITPQKKFLKVDTASGWNLEVTESDIGGGGVDENFEFITVADVDEICGTDYQFATKNEVTF